MRRLLAGACAVGVVGSAGGLGAGVANADSTYPYLDPGGVGDASTAQVVYALGGARAPGVPWADYTNRSGAEYFPGAQRVLVDYPAGAAWSWVPDQFLPAGTVKDHMTIGVAVADATRSLDTRIHNGTAPAAAVGLSQGSMVLDKEQVRLASDPKAPPPDSLSFTTFGDPMGRNAFGTSFLAGMFAPGAYVPVIDYTMPKDVPSQYDTNKVVAAYDGIADFPDRPDNLISVANAFAAGVFAHTPAAFTGPGDVPEQNRRTTVNSRGATTTTYLVPVNQLPLTLPLRYIGLSQGFVDQVDATLQPIVDAGYSRNDNPDTKPIQVDHARGMDPIMALDPESRDGILNGFGQVRDAIAAAGIPLP
jgi:hypothetical protein